MYGMLVETLVITFVMGGILGAITALHLAAPKKAEISKNIDNKTPNNRG